MIKFPSIEQFRNVIRHVQQQTRYVGRDAYCAALDAHAARADHKPFLMTCGV